METHFFFLLSIYRMLGKESQVPLNQLSWVVDKKLEEPVSYVRGWING